MRTATGRGALLNSAALCNVICAAAMGLTACLQPAQVVKTEAQLSQVESDADGAVDAARKEAAAHPGDHGAQQKLAAVYLEARRYAEAYDTIQSLRQAHPEDIGDLEMLGHACYGLGLFDEAAACFNGAFQARPDDADAAWWLAHILVARGNYPEARQVLSAAPRKDPDQAKRFEALDAQLAEETELTECGWTVIDGENGGSATGQTSLSDTYTVSLKINGYPARVLFDTGASGLHISDNLAAQLQLGQGKETTIRGMGGSTVGAAWSVTLDRIELGGLMLQDVPASVLPDVLDVTSYQGIMGPDLFAGCSYQLDRRDGVLLLNASAGALPPPSPKAVTQRYYEIGGDIVSDVTVHNRVSKQSWKTKMVFDTGSSITLLDLGYANRLRFGELNTTETVTMVGVAGYSKAVAVRQCAIRLAGANFEYDTFMAHDLKRLGGSFMPYGLLGRDILAWFRITVDAHNRMLILDPYE